MRNDGHEIITDFGSYTAREDGGRVIRVIVNLILSSLYL